MKVLVIFVGFTEDQYDSNCGNYNDPNWPQLPPGAVTPGQTLPTNYLADCYTSNAQFSLTANDQSLSNFFYQMSRTSPSPLRMTFGTLPGRINVTAGGRGNSLITYASEALTAAAAAYPNFNWGAYDNRVNQPNYHADPLVADGPDGKLDYVVFCFRGGGCASGVGGMNGLGGVAQQTIPGTAYSVETGHCQTSMSLDKSLFLHEMAHTLWNAPHQFGCNGTVGKRFYNTFGWSMMTSIPTNYSVSAWERWYLGWTELKTGPAQVNSDVQGPASLTATSGQYVLRDYVTTGDVIRVKIPNTTQYLVAGKPGLQHGALRPPHLGDRGRRAGIPARAHRPAGNGGRHGRPVHVS